ncbi:oligopeptide transporter [Talaromyces proteolyticus]|uniref:Oligopeptide transporter n=1 Tax=Talaromyces proteolyticus TaxID=1131652 RepID=A0AAD4KG51_9EURO|nr:oligopeptide transporter [Talaromyces proteolyticus]KAH8690261.1 oligopeptide transporter [Talaromyces proteolyticus]
MPGPEPTTNIVDVTSHTPLLPSNDTQQAYGTENGGADELAVSDCSDVELYDHLRKIPDSLPLTVWLIATIELCEKFAYFGTTAPLQNYIQNSRDDPLRPGGLGLGQAKATIVNLGFMMWCFVTPLIGAAISEQYLGRVKTIIFSSIFYICGSVVLVFSSIPLVQDIGLSFAALILSLFLIGIGAGGIRANVVTLVAEQYTSPKEKIRVLDSGEKVIIDEKLTLQRIVTTFFIYVNIGSFSSLATTAIEKYHGFTAAFALPLLVFLIGFAIMMASKDRYVSHPPDNSILFNAGRVLWIALKNRCNLDSARPSYRAEEELVEILPWDDSFIDDLKNTIVSSRVFLLFPFFWATYSQCLTNFVSQAGTMETHGIPNDLISIIDNISVLILLPTCDRVVLPLLRRMGAPLRTIDRIQVGFMLCGIAMLYTAFVQRRIYSSPPCYDHPRALDCLDGRVPNRISVFYQAPSYVLIAASEVFAAVAGNEYAFATAPKSMKSLVMAIYLSSVSVGALLAMTVSPLTVDPKLPWMYLTLGVGTIISGSCFHFVRAGGI